MSDEQTIRFHTPGIFSGTTGTINPDTCTIHGVSLITGDCVAEGHDLSVDNETVNQLHALASARGMVPVNLDHGSGVKDMNGYIDGFRMDGNKLRGDWHLMKSHEETTKMMERAETMPTCFGLSVAFKGKGVAVKGSLNKAARAEKLLSVDCVTRPAANSDGLFGAIETSRVDTSKKDMAEKLEQQDKEPTIADVMKAIGEISKRIDAQEQIQSQIVDHINTQIEQGTGEVDRDLLEQLYKSTDEELASHGLTREEVNAAVDQYNASLGDEAGQNGAPAGQNGQGQPGQNGPAGQDGAAAGAGAPNAMAGVESAGQGAGATMLRALQNDVIALKAKITATELKAKQEGEEIQFAEIESKMVTLATQRDKAIELAEKLVAENEALHIHLRTGTRPVKAGVNDGVRLFSAGENGELHEFQAKVQGYMASEKLTEAKALLFAIKKHPEMHAAWLQSGSRTIHA